jgi:phosphonate transport system ATP-binding protein
MRLICEVCAERHLAAIINIHDVALAQLFVPRVIGLRAGRIVFDGAPESLTPEALTEIYGEEDWTQTTRERPEPTDSTGTVPAHHEVAIDRDRLAGVR